MTRETLMDGEAVRLRIYVGEDEQKSHVSLYDVLLERFMEAGIAGVTVFQGVGGYGGENQLRTAKLLRFSADLPMVVEAVDTKERIDEALTIADELVQAGLITTEPVQARQYRRQKRE